MEVKMTDSIIKLFDNSEIRFVDHPEGKFGFGIVAEDMAKVLEHSNSRAMSEAIDVEWKGVSNVYTLGGTQSMTVIWEAGVYQLLAVSRKPKAKAFQKWLFEEVLPSIRKTGSYGVAPKQVELPQNYLEALKCLVASEEQKALLTAKIEKDAPLVDYAEQVQSSESDVDFNAFAKMMGTGRTRLFRILREMEVIMQNSTLPYQKFFDADYFECCQEITGDGKLRPYAVITGKGQIWLKQKLNHFWQEKESSQISLFN